MQETTTTTCLKYENTFKTSDNALGRKDKILQLVIIFNEAALRSHAWLPCEMVTDFWT
jgi:hypothetical protein